MIASFERRADYNDTSIDIFSFQYSSRYIHKLTQVCNITDQTNIPFDDFLN